mmetsp:Transcript_59328/g.130282  ORF Transcript_59328/g.130282 Transcript_59328/m.130282 type:complete len:80 (-) Transcript_59328:107-346(-)
MRRPVQSAHLVRLPLLSEGRLGAAVVDPSEKAALVAHHLAQVQKSTGRGGWNRQCESDIVVIAGGQANDDVVLGRPRKV